MDTVFFYCLLLFTICSIDAFAQSKYFSYKGMPAGCSVNVTTMTTKYAYLENGVASLTL